MKLTRNFGSLTVPGIGDETRGWIAYLLASQVLLVILILSIGPKIALILVPIPFLIILARAPIYAVCMFILLHAVIFKETRNISPGEIIFAAYYAFLLVLWLYDKKVRKAERIIQTKLDAFLLVFLLLASFSIVPGILYGVSLLKWLRELIPLLTLLIIFPLSDYVNSDKDMTRIMQAFLVLSVYVLMRNLYHYLYSIKHIEYIWQYASARQSANEPILTTIVIMSASYFLFSKGFMKRLLSTLLFGGFLVALLITFSRGYWIAVAIGLLWMSIFLPLKRKIIIIASLIVSFIALFLFLHFLFGQSYQKILEAIFVRLSSIENLANDISIKNRIEESKAVWKLISLNPILGYGLGKTYVFIPLLPRELPTWYVHNAYLYMWFKIGVLGLGALLLFYLQSIRIGIQCFYRTKDTRLSPFVIGATSVLVALSFVAITSPQFIQKDSLMIMGTAIGGLRAIHKKPDRILAFS